jgi:hypothetical protein
MTAGRRLNRHERAGYQRHDRHNHSHRTHRSLPSRSILSHLLDGRDAASRSTLSVRFVVT